MPAPNWIKLSKESVKLASGATEIIPFALEVPGDTAAGEHNGCIAIQETGQTPQAAGNGIALSFRSAIRVAVTVKGDIKKGLSFTRLESSEGKDDKRLINTALKNNGNVSLDTEVEVKIKSILGTTVRETGGEFPILAGGESEFNFETSEPFWGGIYFLSAKAAYNADPSAGLGNGDKSAAVTQTKILLTAPKPLAAIIELVVLASVTAVSIFFWRRRRQHKQWHSDGKIYIVRESDSIQHIAEKFGLSWKAIARINRLKAPYHLKAGDRLKLLPKSAHSTQTPPVKRPHKTRK